MPLDDDKERSSVQLTSENDPGTNSTASRPVKFWRKWNDRIEGLAGFEARGLERVPDDERLAPSNENFLQMLLLWFSSNMAIIASAASMTGPLVFGLGFVDSSLLAAFGTLLGGMTTAYMSTWGPISGNRTMVVARFIMGYYPSKICAFLNIVLLCGYSLLDCIVGGQVLSAVSGGGLSIAVGVVVVAVIMCVLAVIGLRVFNYYQRYAWLPQLLALFVLIGAAGSRFDSSLKPSVSGRTLTANQFSFFSLMFYLPNSWVASAADYYVYYPAETPRWKVFVITTTGLMMALVIVDIIGIALASGVASHPAWAKASSISSGALVVEGLNPIGTFGKFCAVILALGVISNAVMGTYSAAIDCQILGRFGQKVPRWIWVVILSAIELVCGVAGRNKLFLIFTNFLAIMAYWLTIMMGIFMEEELFFRGRHLDWTAWTDRSKMPVGFAALFAFLLGWLGAVLGMNQIYYVGPLAKLAGYSDIGMWVGFGFTILSYPPLRMTELRRFGR